MIQNSTNCWPNPNYLTESTTRKRTIADWQNPQVKQNMPAPIQSSFFPPSQLRQQSNPSSRLWPRKTRGWLQITSPAQVWSKQLRFAMECGELTIIDLLMSYVPYWYWPVSSQDGCNWPCCPIKQSIMPQPGFPRRWINTATLSAPYRQSTKWVPGVWYHNAFR